MPRNYYQFCTSVTPECPVEATLYGYYPLLSVNALYASLFALLFLSQLAIGIRTKTWTYMLAVSLGTFGEMAGYIGRLIMHKNPWSVAGFEMQICCLVLSPSFLAAGIYLMLKHMVLKEGGEFSRLKPNWYPWIFIGSDLGSIIVQAVGGGVAASATHGTNKTLLTVGDALIIAGIALQSVTMSVCALVIFDFYISRRKHRTQVTKIELETTDNSADFGGGRVGNGGGGERGVREGETKRFKIFCWGMGFAFMTILIRCVYRIPEMAGGWGNPRMRDEHTFLALDGGMVALASIALTVFHPGFMFRGLKSGWRS